MHTVPGPRASLPAVGATALAAVLLSSLVACTGPSVDDELAIDDATEGADDGKADGDGTYTYYFIEFDARRCASPFCGGYFYWLANAGSTKCLDGTRQDRCYAATADWSASGLDDSGMGKVNAAQGSLLVRATIRRRDWGPELGDHGELRVTEAWPGQWPVAHDGVIARIQPATGACTTSPCPTLRERKLNSSARANLVDVGLVDAGVSPDEAADLLANLPIIIAGDRYWIDGARARSVTQLWRRAENDQCPIIDCAAPPPGCHYEGMVFSPCDAQTCGTLVCTEPPF